MIENVKLNTLYVNNKSNQQTYLFFQENGKLYGARKDEHSDWDWKFATWSSYSGNNSEHIEEIKDLEELQRQTIITLWDYPAKFLQGE